MTLQMCLFVYQTGKLLDTFLTFHPHDLGCKFYSLDTCSAYILLLRVPVKEFHAK